MIMIMKNIMQLLLLQLLLMMMIMNTIITTAAITIIFKAYQYEATSMKIDKTSYNGCNVESTHLSMCFGRDRIPLLKGYGQPLEQKRPPLE